MALIVAIVHIPRFLCSLYVLSLWTVCVHFAHGVNSGYSTSQNPIEYVYAFKMYIDISINQNRKK